MTGYRYTDEGGRHLHTLNGEPLIGCSTAKSIIGKGDALLNWGVNAAVDYIKDAGIWALGGDDGVRLRCSREELASVLEEARSAHIRKRDAAAEKGTDRHSRLEDYLKVCVQMNGGKPIGVPEEIPEAYAPDVETFIRWSMEHVERFLFTEANCYSERLWVGGIADIGMLLKDGRRVVGDHKSSKAAYFDQFIQTAIYDLLLSENGGLTADGEKRFDWKPADGFVIFPFRSSPFTPEFRWNADEHRKAAEEVVHIYKLANGMKVS